MMKHSAAAKESKPFLPEDSKSAVIVMTQLTRQMLEFVMEEGKLLKARDAENMLKIQKGKELRANGYTAASREFQTRMNEFKNMDVHLIGKLEALTIELGKATRINQNLIEKMSVKKPLNESFVNNLFLLQGDQAGRVAE